MIMITNFIIYTISCHLCKQRDDTDKYIPTISQLLFLVSNSESGIISCFRQKKEKALKTRQGIG